MGNICYMTTTKKYHASLTRQSLAHYYVLFVCWLVLSWLVNIMLTFQSWCCFLKFGKSYLEQYGNQGFILVFHSFLNNVMVSHILCNHGLLYQWMDWYPYRCPIYFWSPWFTRSSRANKYLNLKKSIYSYFVKNP